MGKVRKLKSLGIANQKKRVPRYNLAKAHQGTLITTIVSGRLGQVSALIGVAKTASRAIRTSRSILGPRGVSSQFRVDLVD
jgi:hypothetical protein